MAKFRLIEYDSKQKLLTVDIEVEKATDTFTIEADFDNLALAHDMFDEPKIQGRIRTPFYAWLRQT
jgi:hypothetical protein